MDAFETFEHAGFTCELHQDPEPISPAEWDNLGTLVAFPSLAREYTIAERESTRTEDEAVERGGAALLVRYLRMAEGAIAVPFHFADYGSSGARIWATGLDDDNPSGFILATHDRVTELCGEGAKYHSVEWIEEALRGELETWGDYVEGNVVGFVVRDPETGAVLDSCWSFYPDRGGDGLDYVRGEAKTSAEAEAHDRAVNAEPDLEHAVFERTRP